MANVRKRILELTALESASLNTTIVGVDGGITYKIELDTLADAVTSRVNILDRDRLASLESVTSSFEIKGRSVISSSAQITTLGFISSSTSIPAGTISSSAQITLFGFVSSSIDITSLNSFTSSQSSLNTAFTNGITARLQTSSFNEYTSSQSTSSLVDRLNTIESVSGSWITESETGSFLTSLSGAISSSSQLTSSYDTRYTLSGSVPNIPTGSFATTGSNTFIGEQIISSSLIVTNEIKGIGNIFLQPDVNDARYFQIYNTAAPSGNDIHFKGNTDFNYFGDDTNYLKIDDSAQTITITGVNGVFVSSSLNVTDSINGTINATNGVISGSSQLISSFDTRYTLSGSVSAVPSGTISGSSQLTSSYDARYTLSSSFSSISSSFNSRFNGLVTTGSNTFSGSQIFSGSMVVTSGQIIASAITNNSSSLFLQSGSNLYVQNNGLVEITGSLNATSITGSIAATNGVISGSTQLTTAFPSKTTGAWSVPAGASTQSFTVEAGASYTMWVNGNIPNGIITWNATVTTSNTNVPVVGSQYGWYYTAGNALVLTAMPDQIIGTTNTLISSPTSYAPNTSNVFKFGITNNSGTTQTINYGYIKLS